MRIISGTARGTKLYTLEGKTTRPTVDRVKESLFNIIQNEIADSTVLDLFSGSGAVGLEFASRGAKTVYLCDKSKEACEIIDKNIEKTHLGNKVKLMNHNTKKIVEYTLVGESEANLKEGKIAAATPIGKALIGKCKGDIVEVTIPAGKLKLEVLEISF